MTVKTLIAAAGLLVVGQCAWGQSDGTNFTIVYNEDGSTKENGSEALPFLIDSEIRLMDLAEDVNNGVNYSGVYFKLTEDLNFTRRTFTPIGFGDEQEEEKRSFKGVFDGNNKTIKGIIYSGIIYSEEGGVGVGIFGYITPPAVIKNLNVENCKFTGNFEVGAIAGAFDGTDDKNEFGIFNCTVGNDVEVTAQSFLRDGENIDGAYAGGIIGGCTNLTLKNCVSAATVRGDKYVGGIVGRFLSSNKNLGEEERGVVEDCYYIGQGVTGSAHTGDIAGKRGPAEEYDGDGTEGLYKITLLDDDTNAEIKNQTRMKNYEGQVCNVTLSGRTLYGGEWNTLCLPFSVEGESQAGATDEEKKILKGTCLEGACVKALSAETTFADGTLTLNFDDLEAIPANQPVIVKPSSQVTDPTFVGVTLAVPAATPKTETEYVDMVGVNAPYTLAAGNTSLYLGAQNTLYYPSADVPINAFRAYFELKNGLTIAEDSEEPGQPATTSKTISTLKLNLGGGETGIHLTPALVGNESWFTLDGRRIVGKPSQQGFYIHNGKKMILK